MNASHQSRGFSLVEMVVTILIFGLVMAFSVPAFQSFNQTNQLHGAIENLAANLRLLREKAIATGQTQTLHFTMNYPPGTTWDYHVHNGVTTSPGWDLPQGVNYYAIGVNPTFDTQGRSNGSGVVVLQNSRGERDTVSIQLSGLVLTK